MYDTLFSILKDESCLQEFFKAIYLRTAQQGRAGILTFEMPQRRAKSAASYGLYDRAFFQHRLHFAAADVAFQAKLEMLVFLPMAIRTAGSTADRQL